MSERLERLLRVVCLILAGALIVRFGWGLVHVNPLAHLKIPAVPTLEAHDSTSGGKGTNSATQPTANKATNAVAAGMQNQTNSPGTGKKDSTNTAPASAVQKTNSSSAIAKSTGSDTNSMSGTNTVSHTNALVSAGEQSRTNAPTAVDKKATNAVTQAGSPSKSASTNSPSPKMAANANPPMPGMPGMPGMPAKPRELSPEIQARVDRITDSEILGPVMRPLPMALLGIAGNVAFLRTSTGQTGVIKEGEDLGDLKLLRIGINRVLVEQEGQKKELMIFSGLGGESLLPKESTSTP